MVGTSTWHAEGIPDEHQKLRRVFQHFFCVAQSSLLDGSAVDALGKNTFEVLKTHVVESLALENQGVGKVLVGREELQIGSRAADNLRGGRRRTDRFPTEKIFVERLPFLLGL